MAGGWFFLTVNEAFTLGNKDYRLPGIGSYMNQAINDDNKPAMIHADQLDHKHDSITCHGTNDTVYLRAEDTSKGCAHVILVKGKAAAKSTDVVIAAKRH